MRVRQGFDKASCLFFYALNVAIRASGFNYLQIEVLQIETLKQDSSLDSSQLQDYQARSERIQQLYGELDRIRGARIEFKFARAS